MATAKAAKETDHLGGRQRREGPSQSRRGAGPRQHLDFDLWPPGPWGVSLLFLPPSVWGFSATATGNAGKVLTGHTRRWA